MKNLMIGVVLLMSIMQSCKKPEDRKCWKFTGDTKTIEFPLEDFDKLMLNSHIAYEIIQDSLNKIEIRGGENLVNLIEFSVQDKLLTIKNRNKCAFLRNAKKELVVTIHLTNLVNIRYEGSEYLNSIGQIKTDYLAMLIRDGAGPVNLNLKSLVIYADIAHGWGDYTLTGETKYARIGAKSNGYCNTLGLNILDSVYVSSDTPGTIKLKADGIPLRGFAKNSGDIWYKGTPSLIDVVLTGEGEVLNMN